MNRTMPTERKRPSLRPITIGRALLLLAGFVLLLGLFGAVYQQLAQRRLTAAFPPPGRLVTVVSRQMHIVCQGEGEPTVILDAGQGGWSSDWQTLLPSLAQQRRVCAYDRAGYGWSQAADDDRSPAASAQDLAQLLAAADIEPPYVLVAFSRSGLAARIFAAEHREQLAGLILVDPATEFDNELLGEELLRQQQAAVPVFQTFRLAAAVGLLHLLGTENMAGSAPFIATTHPDPAPLKAH